MVYTITAAACNQNETYKVVKFDMELSDVRNVGHIWEATRNAVMDVAKKIGIDVVAVGLLDYKEKV